MPPVSRITDKTNTGHLCTPVTIIGLVTNTTVFAQMLPIARQMDQTIFHPIEVSLNPLVCAPHVGVIMNGSRTVIVSKMLCSRIGDPCDLAKIGLITGAMTVIAGG